MKKEGFIRKASGLEAFFVDLDAAGSKMTIHFYLELTQKPDVDLLRSTMKQLLATHTGVNMRYFKNSWYISSYNYDCPLIDIDAEDLSSYTPPPLDISESTVGIKVLHATLSDTWYICFDFFHGVMDGRSCVQFVYDFFDVLNNREFLEPVFNLAAFDLLKKKRKTRVTDTKTAFTVIPQCSPNNWETKKEGKDKNLLVSSPKTIRAVAAHLVDIVSKLFDEKSAKMIIPIDIRRYTDVENKNLYGNLFVPMLLDVAQFHAWTETRDVIMRFVKNVAYIVNLAKKFNIYCMFPIKLRQFVLRKAIPWVMSRKKFIYCALVSSIGVIDSGRLCHADFAVKNCVFSFISFPFTAFSLVSLQYQGRTNTMISWHSARVPSKIANDLVEKIKECIISEDSLESSVT